MEFQKVLIVFKPDPLLQIINPALDIVALSRTQYCVVRNPWDSESRAQMGRLELR